MTTRFARVGGRERLQFGQRLRPEAQRVLDGDHDPRACLFEPRECLPQQRKLPDRAFRQVGLSKLLQQVFEDLGTAQAHASDAHRSMRSRQGFECFED